MSKVFLTDAVFRGFSAYTTELLYAIPTANRTIMVPDSSGTMALVPGISGQVVFNLNGSLSANNRLTYDSTAGLRTTLPLGYGTGAGGTATQLTSKSTGVTLNRVTGQITCSGESLAANSTVSFTLTNSLIASGDVLILNHISGGTAGSYALNAQSAAGSASINIRNLSATPLAEAIVIAFAVIKGVIN